MSTASTVEVTVLLFAAAQDAAGTGSIAFQVETPAPLSRIVALASEALPGLSSFLQAPYLLAVDEEYAEADTVVSKACEVAILPPVSGG